MIKADMLNDEQKNALKKHFPLDNLKKIQKELQEQIKNAPDYQTRRVLHFMLDSIESTTVLLYLKEVI